MLQLHDKVIIKQHVMLTSDGFKVYKQMRHTEILEIIDINNSKLDKGYRLKGHKGFFKICQLEKIIGDYCYNAYALGEYYYRKFYIPRKNKKPRQITAPSFNLLRYQQAGILELKNYFYYLERYYDIHGIMNGFIPGRNGMTAAKQHIGYDYTIMMDISHFFDSIHKTHFNLPLDDKFFTQEGYCGQGFATSPMLANIAITPIVASINSYLKNKFTEKNFIFTMYADDIQISIKNIKFSHSLYAELKLDIAQIFKAYSLEINKKKTRVRFAKCGFRRILGVNVGKSNISRTRAVRRKIRAAKHQNNTQSLSGLVEWSKCKLPRMYVKYWSSNEDYETMSFLS